MDKITASRVTLIIIALAMIFIVNLACEKQSGGFNISLPQLPPIPEDGEEVIIHIVGSYEDGTGIQGIKVLFTETTVGSSWMQLTDENGVASLTLRCGSNYTISAEFQESSKEITHKIEGAEIVGILVSEDNTIQSIVFEPAILYP